MSLCKHESIVDEEIDGIAQKLCTDCGEIFEYNLGFVNDDNFLFETGINPTKMCDVEYIPPIIKAEKVNNHLGSLNRFWTSYSVKKDIMNIIYRLKIPFSEQIAAKTLDLYLSLRKYSPHHKGKIALIVECLFHVVPDSEGLPPIRTVCNTLGIPVHDITRAKKLIKSFHNYSEDIKLPCSDFQLIRSHFEIINEAEKLFIDEEKTEGIELSERLLRLFEKCKKIPIKETEVSAKVLLVMSRIFLNYKKQLKIKPTFYLRKFSKEEHSKRYYFNNILSMLSRHLAWAPRKMTTAQLSSSLLDIIIYVESMSESAVEKLLVKISRHTNNRINTIRRIREEFQTCEKPESSLVNKTSEFYSEKDAIISVMKQGLTDEQILETNTAQMYHESLKRRLPFITEDDIDKDADKYIKTYSETLLSEKYIDKDVNL